jgi:hypothetical protein
MGWRDIGAGLRMLVCDSCGSERFRPVVGGEACVNCGWPAKYTGLVARHPPEPQSDPQAPLRLTKRS